MLASPAESAIRIGNTLQASGLDPETYVMCGGGVLGLYGIREPRDVDILLVPELFDQLQADGHTPSGISLTVNAEIDPPNIHIFGQGHHRGAGEIPEDQLPLHIKVFSPAQLKNIRTVTTHDALGRPIRHLTLEEVLRRKVFSQRPFEEDRIKDGQDADLIAHYLQS